MFINKINIVVKRRAVILNTTEDNLKYHIRTVHLGIRYTCDECGIKLKSQSILMNHIRVVHFKIVEKCKTFRDYI